MNLFEEHLPTGIHTGTIVCLPGVNSGAYLMEGIIPAMGANWRILRLNPSGVAGNALPIPFSVKSYARQALETIVQQNVREPFVLLGHSLGGFAAQELARMAPDRIKRLVLVSTSRGQPDTALDVAALKQRTGMGFWELQKLIAENDAVGHLPWFGPGFAEREPEVFATFLKIRRKWLPGQAATMAHLSAGGMFSSVPWVRKLRMPALVIHGNEDKLVSVASGRRLAEALPLAQWLELYNVGHFPMLEYEGFWDKVRQFAEDGSIGVAAEMPENWVRRMIKGWWIRG